MAADLAALENLFLGLADKTRLRLLSLMAPGPVSVGHLVAETGESQPKISRHLAYLRNAGLVDTTRDGKWIYYGLADLKDGIADSVFRCVVDELSDTPAIRKPKVVDPSTGPEPASEVQAAPEEHLYGHVQSEMHWDHPSEPSEGAHNELEVFLL